MNITTRKNIIDGLKAKDKKLADEEKIFLEALGIEKEIAKIGVEVDDIETKLQATKEELKENEDEKAEAVAITVKALAEKMAEVLPAGKAIFEINEGKCFLGWLIDKKRKPYKGLSGGELHTFNSALMHALNCEVLIQESAEIDLETLPDVLGKLSEVKKQVIALTCHWRDDIPFPEGWNVVRLK